LLVRRRSSEFEQRRRSGASEGATRAALAAGSEEDEATLHTTHDNSESDSDSGDEFIVGSEERSARLSEDGRSRSAGVQAGLRSRSTSATSDGVFSGDFGSGDDEGSGDDGAEDDDDGNEGWGAEDDVWAAAPLLRTDVEVRWTHSLHSQYPFKKNCHPLLASVCFWVPLYDIFAL
jgi:hypothetical protein